MLKYLEDPRPDIKDLIIVQYGGMVERVARRFAGIEPQEDLVQVGFIGLLNALSKFNPTNGVRFNTYATHLVAGEIKHYLRDRTQTIRHPAWLQELRHKVMRAANGLQATLSRPPTEAEIASNLGLSESAVREVFQTGEMLKVASLDATVNSEDDGDTEGERLDAASFSPEQLTVEDRVVLESAMSHLRDLEREVLVAFHFDSLSQTEIASQWGISCNYVSHILRGSLNKLRRILAVEEGEEQARRSEEGSEVIEISGIDSLTGMLDGNAFKARLQEELHRSSANNSQLSLVLIEFDGLSRLSGHFGVAAVQDLIAGVGSLLKQSVRKLDVVTRHGKNGFAVILPTLGSNAPKIANRLNQAVSDWLKNASGPASSVSVRVGWSSYPEAGKTASRLITEAKPIGGPVDVQSQQNDRKVA